MTRKKKYGDQVRITLPLERSERDAIDAHRGAQISRVMWIQTVVRIALEKISKAGGR